VGFHVGSNPGGRHRRWPAEHFAELGKRIVEKHNATLILLEGPDDRESVESVKVALGSVPAITSKELSLREEMALVDRMDLLVSNNSLWMHVAAATETPVVGMFGPNPAERYHPWGDSEITKWISSPASCAPCRTQRVDIECKNMHCMRQISVDMIEAVAELFLRRKGTRP